MKESTKDTKDESTKDTKGLKKLRLFAEEAPLGSL